MSKILAADDLPAIIQGGDATQSVLLIKNKAGTTILEVKGDGTGTVPGGGAVLKRARYQHDENIAILDASTDCSWVLLDNADILPPNDDILDLTVPTAPIAKASGLYTVTASIIANADTPATTEWILHLSEADDYPSEARKEWAAGTGAKRSMSVSGYVPIGGILRSQLISHFASGPVAWFPTFAAFVIFQPIVL